MKRLLTILLGVALCATSVNAQLIGRPGSLVAAANGSAPQQNLVLYSEQLDNAAWLKTNITITTNVEDDLDGNTTLDRAVPTAATASYLSQNLSNLTESTDYVFYFEAAHDGSWGSNDLICYAQDNSDYSELATLTYHTDISTSVTAVTLEFTTPATINSTIAVGLISCSWLDENVTLGRVHLYEGDIGDKSYITTTSSAYDP